MILEWVRRIRSRDAQPAPVQTAVAAASTPEVPRYPPADVGLQVRSTEDILAANADLLDRLRLHAAVDQQQFDLRFKQPLARLAQYINVIPATATGLFSGEMGLFRAALECGFFAFQASDGRIFTGSEGVERRHALEGRWRYLCFLAAMFYPLGMPLETIVVADPQGKVWKRHFSGISAWAQEVGATRLFASWGAEQDKIGPSNCVLQILPAVVGPENLQMLQDGAADLVSSLFQLAAGEAGTSRIAHQVVSQCWDKIARREAARRPQAYGRLTSGTHQGPYLAGAVRALVDGGQWMPNKSALKADRDGLYLEWPRAADDLIAFGRERNYAGWPADAATLAALLKAAKLVEDRGEELGLIEIVDDSGEILHALKVANPLAVLEDFDASAYAGRAPRTLDAVLAADPLAKAQTAPTPEQAGAEEQPAAAVQAPPATKAQAQQPAAQPDAAPVKAAKEPEGLPVDGDEEAVAAVAAPTYVAAPSAAGPRAQAKRTGGNAAPSELQEKGKLREAPEVRYADLVPEDIRAEIGSALQIELLGKIVKAWRERGENSAVMRRIDSGAAIAFTFLSTQMRDAATWVDTMARVGLIYSSAQEPGNRVHKVAIPEGRQPVPAIVLSNLACRRLGL